MLDMLPVSVSVLALSCWSASAATVPLEPRAAALPPKVSGTTAVRNATLTFKWPIQRDGGGGGTINGTHIINFSDTTTLNQDFENTYGYYPFVSNTIATTDSKGTTLKDYGSDYAVQEWPFATTSTPINGVTNETAPKNYRTAIWPNTNLVSGCSGQCAYTVSQVLNISFTPYTTKNLYTTVAKVTLGSSGAPSVSRTAVRLFYPNEINYGLFSLARARDGSNDIFLFAAPAGAFGMKVARVAEASIGDRSKYTYWNGSNWIATPPAAANQPANIFNYNVGGYGPGTGVSVSSDMADVVHADFNAGHLLVRLLRHVARRLLRRLVARRHVQTHVLYQRCHHRTVVDVSEPVCDAGMLRMSHKLQLR